ncbi:hypothetical protein BBP40_010949 [Aspergillus hancockii]|nr:hypothetical protein BBP40_010949 [Aspergillus hancockii]
MTSTPSYVYARPTTSRENPSTKPLYLNLDNQKYTVQTCLFDRSNSGSIDNCEDSCRPLQNVYKDNWYSGKNFTPIYEYCDDAGFMQYADNFIDTMDSACETKPNASKGEIVHLRESLFSVPPADATATPSATTEPDASSGLSTGAKAGIGVGAGVGGLIVLGALIWVLCLRRRRSKRVHAYQYERPWQQSVDEPVLSPRDGILSEMPADGVVKGPMELPVEEHGTGKNKKTPPPVELP